MSASGTKQTFIPTLSMSALRGRADIPDPLAKGRVFFLKLSFDVVQ